MISKIKIVCLISIVLIMTCLSGCNRNDDVTVKVYYLNIDKTALLPIDMDIDADNTDDKIKKLITVLSTDSQSVKYIRPIPSDVTVREHKLNEGSLVIDFSPQYNNLTGEDEVLVRSAVVKTMLQLDDVSEVAFTVMGKPLSDSDGNVLEPLRSGSFLDDYIDETRHTINKEVKLYYATENGEDLICEERTIELDSRVQVADVVLDYIRKKPETKGAQVAIPDDTKVLSTSVYEGVCYVNLDSSLLTEKSDVSNRAIIYSIVNSLCDSLDITSVVIKTSNVNEDVQTNYLDISGTYVKDQSIVVEALIY